MNACMNCLHKPKWMVVRSKALNMDTRNGICRNPLNPDKTPFMYTNLPEYCEYWETTEA